VVEIRGTSTTRSVNSCLYASTAKGGMLEACAVELLIDLNVTFPSFLYRVMIGVVIEEIFQGVIKLKKLK
jgi:hypothetical protein